MTHEPEITQPVDLCTPDGTLNPEALGWSRRPLHRANLTGFPGRNKRWDYWAVLAGEGRSDLFIHPPFAFSAVDALITNFHLPQSTLLMLVSAFAGRERVLAAYAEAIAQGYLFYSYGDAMLIH